MSNSNQQVFSRGGTRSSSRRPSGQNSANDNRPNTNNYTQSVSYATSQVSVPVSGYAQSMPISGFSSALGGGGSSGLGLGGSGITSGTMSAYGNGSSQVSSYPPNMTQLSSKGGGGGGGGGGGTSAGSQYFSEIEASILRSNETPVQIDETEELSVNGQRGIWANKSEVVNWKGPMPIEQYAINEDVNPEILTKKVNQQLEYIQELAIRYLRPPTPPAPGEIVITQEPNVLTPPAPPLVIRQQPPRPVTPEPLIIREAPPRPPAAIGRKLITIFGRRLPPPPRKVIIERLAPLPSKPQSVIIERWLPYNDNLKRRVVFQKAPADPVILKPRNIIVQWEAPTVSVKKEFKYLGIVRANPNEYVQRYGSALKIPSDLPELVNEIKNPDGLVLAADYKYKAMHELEGDLEALKFVDLDREGLAEYKTYLQRLGITYGSQPVGYSPDNFTPINNGILTDSYSNSNSNNNSPYEPISNYGSNYGSSGFGQESSYF